MQQDRSKLLGTMPMTKLVPKVSIPIMFSMLIQALYNIVDSIFVSRFDPNGLTAVSLAMPFQMLMIALSTGMGTGINSLLSRRLGERNPEGARRGAWNGLLIEVLGSVLFILFGLFLAGQTMGLVVSENLANKESIFSMGTSYLTIVTAASTGLFVAIFFERMLQATGNSVLSMVTQLCGAVTNIILDPIMIFGLLGCPRMGVSGAAVATVIGQFVSAIIGFTLNQKKNPELRLMRKDAIINRHDLSGIVSVGLPSTVMASIGSVMNIGMNAILSGFAQSNAALNVMSVYFKLQSFIFMPVFGLSNGIIAIIAYNYGAKIKERVYSCIKVALVWACVIMLVGTFVFMVFPGQLMSIFESEAEAEITAQMTDIGMVAMRIISSSFLLAAVGIILSTVFQAVGRGTYSMIISICRQLLILLPVAWLIARLTGDVKAVWWCFPTAELFALVLCIFFYNRCNKQMLSKL
ncbi:MATE family efflux transporter [Aristaeella hokkaidonensis]|uniref:MATE family efflux transporter n=1 Tax=Aristaeella hokkaidonensis TaxID=3046382 RepID=A0AC61MYH1_9FIRM|nr:MATE family efflux transporter [Aristaeella hokkaidonensis]QUC68169.1 MATE family efflux transporter [Aristaeella hokkaidonensis]SNT95271.1 putative efflux protein, MATE family [Aristaeella hokkaidonensis]